MSILPSTLLLISLSTAGADPAPAGIEFFEKKIRPVLVKHCYECHSSDAGDDLEAGLRLDYRETAARGGETGPAVVPDNLNASLLYQSLLYEDLEMPPDEQLPATVIADFRRWIEMGAPDPREMPAGMDMDESESEAIAASDLWSLRPVARSATPTVKNESWPRCDIDSFLLAKLEEQGVQPVAPVKPLALLRRLYFDLLGIPPTLEDIDRFSADPSPQAIEELVDRLLDSSQFGERWARHWLDVARFAESNGKDRDVLMPNAWRYRDWVIDAVNADLPYDRFIAEQIAGDLLPAEDFATRDRQRIATGFLALGAKSFTSNLQMDLIDDQIDVVGKAVLGLTVSCARCHDHKFDPIPTADYYALAGIFRSSETLYGGGLKRPKDDAGQAEVLLVLGENADQQIAEIRQRQNKLKNLVAREKRTLARVNQLKKKQSDSASMASSQLAKAEQELAAVRSEIKEFRTAGPTDLQYAIGVREAAKVADCPIHLRGERSQLGEQVSRGFLSRVQVTNTPTVPQSQSGRLQLTAWLTHPEHPLTSRVAVNRTWSHLFGRGLVATVDNFGVNGRPPTHPELLDYLAGRFVAEGWSVKRLIREIVLSQSYQLSADFDQAAYDADPANELYWRMPRRRLEAEAIRDGMLVASGQMDLVRPQASPVARIGNGEVGRGINLNPLSVPFPHRSVYLPIIRGLLPESLTVFDLPEPSNVSGRRDVTNVPAQSLYLMNSPFVIEQATGMAERVLQTEQVDADRVDLAFRLSVGRSPDSGETETILDFLADSSDTPEEAWTSICHSLLASAEFRYIE